MARAARLSSPGLPSVRAHSPPPLRARRAPTRPTDPPALQTMLAVIPLALFVVATGYKALAAIADVRLADSGKGAVAAGKKAN